MRCNYCGRLFVEGDKVLRFVLGELYEKKSKHSLESKDELRFRSQSTMATIHSECAFDVLNAPRLTVVADNDNW